MSLANEWRAKSRAAAVEEADDLSLPSGMVVRARRPGPALLAGMGRLPLALHGRVTPVPGSGAASDADAIEFAGFVRDLLGYCVVEPRISLTPGPDEIHPRDIPDRDLTFLMRWALRGEESERLETFRRESGDGSDCGDGEGVRVQAIRSPGNRGPHDGAGVRSRGDPHLVPV